MENVNFPGVTDMKEWVATRSVAGEILQKVGNDSVIGENDLRNLGSGPLKIRILAKMKAVGVITSVQPGWFRRQMGAGNYYEINVDALKNLMAAPAPPPDPRSSKVGEHRSRMTVLQQREPAQEITEPSSPRRDDAGGNSIASAASLTGPDSNRTGLETGGSSVLPPKGQENKSNRGRRK